MYCTVQRLGRLGDAVGLFIEPAILFEFGKLFLATLGAFYIALAVVANGPEVFGPGALTGVAPRLVLKYNIRTGC